MFYRKMYGSQTCESVKGWTASNKLRHWWGRLYRTVRKRENEPRTGDPMPWRSHPVSQLLVQPFHGLCDRQAGRGGVAQLGHAEPTPGAVPVTAGGKGVVRAPSSLGRRHRSKRRGPGAKRPGCGAHRAANPAFPARWWP